MREEEGGRGACAQTTLDPEHGGTWQAVAGRGFVASGAAELRAAGSCFSLSRCLCLWLLLAGST